MNTLVQNQIKNRNSITQQSDILFENSQLFSCLTKQEKLLLKSYEGLSWYEKGTTIYQQGMCVTGIYYILKGVVKISKTGLPGKEQILRFAQKGDVIAHRSSLTNELACTSAKVIEDVIVCFIRYNILLHLFEQNWKFSLQMMQLICKELKESNSFMTLIAQKSIKERTAKVLLQLKDEFGTDKNNTIRIEITRVELANRIGTATESVIRALSNFKINQLISLDGKKITILDEPSLKEIADFYMGRKR